MLFGFSVFRMATKLIRLANDRKKLAAQGGCGAYLCCLLLFLQL